MNAEADFPMAVVYDNTESPPHTCVLDLGRAGHWPLKGWKLYLLFNDTHKLRLADGDAHKQF